MKFQQFLPFAKVDDNGDDTITVSGIASSEATDNAGEVIRADAMRGALPDFFKHGSGPLREMHQLSAAGTVDEAEVVDDTNKTLITATVVDPVAIKKVKAGVYKGFSIGGKVLQRNSDNRKVIEKISLSEISLVDRPCNPDAVFDVWKADGAEADLENETDAAPKGETAEKGEEAEQFDDTDIAKREFTAAQRKKDARTGVAMKDGSFPIADKEDLENAIRLADKAKNPSAARAHIKRRAKALGAEDMIPDSWKDGAKKADVVENQMPANKVTVTSKPLNGETSEATIEATEKADDVRPAPIDATPVTDVIADGAGTTAGGTETGVPVAGKRTAEPSLPDGGAATPTEVKNPEEAGQATPDALNATDTPDVEHVAGEKPAAGSAAPRGTATRNATQNTAHKADGGKSVSDKGKGGKPKNEREPAAERNATQDTADKDKKKDDKKAADDPVAAAREAADRALKAAASVMDKLSKRDPNEVPAPLRPGFELRKGMFTVGRLASLLCELAYMVSDTKWEAEAEGDNSPIPAQLNENLKALAATYRAMSDEELTELLNGADKSMGVDIALAAAGGDLAKALEGVVDAEELAKIGLDSSLADELAKRDEQIDDLLKTMGGLTDTLQQLSEKVEALENEPVPARTVVMPAGVQAITKTEDTTAISAASAVPEQKPGLTPEQVQKALDSMSPEDRAAALMKAALHPSRAHVITR